MKKTRYFLSFLVLHLEWKPFAKVPFSYLINPLINYSIICLLILHFFRNTNQSLGGNKTTAKDDKNSGKEYHATVTPVANFNALKDADALYDASGKLKDV